MKLALGSDHAGFPLKQVIKKYFDEKGIEYEDLGVLTEERSDYPVYGKKVAEAVASGSFERGILFCGTGVGMSIMANKVHGVRAVVCSETFSATLARQHNNANVLCLGARVVGPGLAIFIVEAFLAAQFEGGRHADRVSMFE